jgi:hypothetical protein
MADSHYCDFDLQIAAVRGGRDKPGLRVQVTGSPAGSSKAAEIRWPFKAGREMLLLKIENAILQRSGATRRGPSTPQEKVLREFGTDMFNAVFRHTHEIATRFEASLNEVRANDQLDGMRVKLTIDSPELAGLPWEYIFDESPQDDGLPSYVCLRSLSPVMRNFDRGPVKDRPAVEGQLNVLGMISNPGGDWRTLDVDAERRALEKVFGGLKKKERVNFHWVKGSTPDDLIVELQKRDWHVFHFIGHGAVAEEEGAGPGARRETCLVFSDAQGRPKLMSPEDVRYILQAGRALRLAVLNCCESGRDESPGAGLVRLGIPAVVAMQFPIPDEAAVQFSKMFYESLVNGQPVERALTDARVSMQLADYRVEWGIPVLFTRGGPNILLKVDRNAPDTTLHDVREGVGDTAAAATAPLAAEATRLREAQAEMRRLLAS